MVVEAAQECLCNSGEFWHWRLERCVAQGSWGYECGFFPPEQRQRVCGNGLKCREPIGVEGAMEDRHYHQGGRPASCVPCAVGDHCPVGRKRHEEECFKGHELSGEACVAVQLGFASLAMKVPDQQDMSAPALAEPTAASAAVAATEVHPATSRDPATPAPSSPGKQTGSPTSARACVGLSDALAALGLGTAPRIGAVLAERVAAAAEDLATRRACEAAAAAAGGRA